MYLVVCNISGTPLGGDGKVNTPKDLSGFCKL